MGNFKEENKMDLFKNQIDLNILARHREDKNSIYYIYSNTSHNCWYFCAGCTVPVKMNPCPPKFGTCGHWWGFVALLAACSVRTTWGIDTFWNGALGGDS